MGSSVNAVPCLKFEDNDNWPRYQEVVDRSVWQLCKELGDVQLCYGKAIGPRDMRAQLRLFVTSSSTETLSTKSTCLGTRT